MLMAFFVPATVTFKSEFFSCSTLGLMMYSPSTRATITPATGPLNGISEIHSANDEPNKDAISELASGSHDNTVLTICTSLRKPSANKGRIGLSIKRAVNVACSVGLPSRRVNPPGILPAAYIFS